MRVAALTARRPARSPLTSCVTYGYIVGVDGTGNVVLASNMAPNDDPTAQCDSYVGAADLDSGAVTLVAAGAVGNASAYASPALSGTVADDGISLWLPGAQSCTYTYMLAKLDYAMSALDQAGFNSYLNSTAGCTGALAPTACQTAGYQGSIARQNVAAWFLVFTSEPATWRTARPTWATSRTAASARTALPATARR